MGSVAMLGVSACRQTAGDAAAASAAKTAWTLPSQAVSQTSETCRDCHAEIFAAWEKTDHALANQPIVAAGLDEAFDPARDLVEGGAAFHAAMQAGHPHLTMKDADGAEIDYLVEGVLGHKPGRQMLVEIEPGRVQPTDLAWDPAKAEWFNVFGAENRRPGEWGHWTGRGMNWNSMCAHCHMTGFRKGYDVAKDTYRSTWVEQGVGCLQCHGPISPEHGRKPTPGKVNYATPEDHWIRRRETSQQTCAYCHARNELLTAEFPPGARYEDHFRITLPVESGVFWPDGQQRQEDFNWTSVKLSRMHHAGVTCMDCHDPHSSKTVLPVENNALCMQCHSAPGRLMATTGVNAPPIDPLAHSHHAEGSTGNQCVACHMPTTNYMERSPRHDHGWLKPDPLMTKERGIPNACSTCHTDQPVEWSIEHADVWYGAKLDSRQRQRTRAVAAAQAGDADAVARLLALLADEDIPAWKATYLGLLNGLPSQPAVQAVATAALADTDPMVRSAAVIVAAREPSGAGRLWPLLDDPVRLVRLDAAWVLPTELSARPDLEREFKQYLALSFDQPSGRLRQGQYLANLGRFAEAAAELDLAVKWDRNSPGIYEVQGYILQAAGRNGDAANAFYRAAQLLPTEGEAMFRAGLAFAGAGRTVEAENALKQAVSRDPRLHRAWYNLGLARAGRGDVAGALEALTRAEEIAPKEPDYPYAAATLYWQKGDRETARAAAQRALVADPNYAPAKALLR